MEPSDSSLHSHRGRCVRVLCALVVVVGAVAILASPAIRQVAAEPTAKPQKKAAPATPATSGIAAPSATKPQEVRKPSDGKRADETNREYTTETVHGKVVWLEDALARQFGVATEPSAAKTAVVLETADGQLLPIIPDTRGRAFAVDAQLRGIDLELLVRRYRDVPMIQVIRVFRTKQAQRYELDYWCDICAISMYILKDCECCQGPTRLREEPVEPDVGKVP